MFSNTLTAQGLLSSFLERHGFPIKTTSKLVKKYLDRHFLGGFGLVSTCFPV